MKRTLTLLPFFMACSPLVPDVNITAVSEGPIEIDTLVDAPIYDENGVIVDESGPFYSEEMSIIVTYSVTGDLDPSTLESVTFDKIKVEYAPLNADGDVPEYQNGFTAHLAPGEYGTYSVRAASFVQKDWAGEQYLGQAVNVMGTITLSGTTSRTTTPITISSDFDMIFANFEDGTTQGGI